MLEAAVVSARLPSITSANRLLSTSCALFRCSRPPNSAIALGHNANFVSAMDSGLMMVRLPERRVAHIPFRAVFFAARYRSCSSYSSNWLLFFQAVFPPIDIHTAYF